MPLAVMAQGSVTWTKNNNQTDPETGETTSVTQRNASGVFSGGSIFLAGKVTDNLGGFIQWTYDNLATTADGTLGGHSSIDNTDIRLAGKYSAAGAADPDWIFGLTLNNNPTVSDPWNSTPAWGFPFTTAPLAVTPAAATLIDGGLAQQVAGLGGYVFWHKTLYGEFAAYRTANVAGNLRVRAAVQHPGGVITVTTLTPTGGLRTRTIGGRTRSWWALRNGCECLPGQPQHLDAYRSLSGCRG